MTAPGWYRDVHDRNIERWWDGRQWTPSTRPRPSQSGIGVAGLCVAAAGIVAVIIALAAADWFDSGHGSLRVSAADLRADPFTPGLTEALFSWLGWLLLGVVGILAVAACLPSPSRHLFRASAAVVGILGAALTAGAMFELADTVHVSFATLLHEFSVGPYLAVFGYLFVAVGAAAGELATVPVTRA